MASNGIKEKFGEKVARLRKEKNISQEQLSFAAGLNRTHIGMIERAEKNVTITTIEKVAKGLNVPVSTLFQFD